MNKPAATSTDPLPHDRYTVVDKLGSGGQGTSFLAEDGESGTEVVVKRLAVEALEDWKSVELFERSIDVLRALDHPAIPDYVDAFEAESDGDAPTGLYVVREFVDGRSLQDAIDEGKRFTERQAREIAEELLAILTYLHDRDPPVVHRDLKPANIIRRPDGSLALVDFGAVQKDVLDESGGSTVVGTTGYVPPEQLTGDASPASDLYALGATLVHLLTHRPPSELPVSRMKLQFRDHADLSASFAGFLDRLLAPEVDERLSGAERARQMLERPDDLPSDPEDAGGAVTSPDLDPPSGSNLVVDRSDEGLRIAIPGERFGLAGWLGVAWFVSVPMLVAGGLPHGLSLVFGLTLPFVAFALLRRLLTRSAPTELLVDDSHVTVRRSPAGGRHTRTIYSKPLEHFSGLADLPFKKVEEHETTAFGSLSVKIDSNILWKVTQENEAGEQFRFRNPDHFLTILPEGESEDELLGVEANVLPHVFIEPGGDLSLGERRWIIETVEEAVERKMEEGASPPEMG